MIALLLLAAARADISPVEPPRHGATWPALALDAPPWPAWAWGSVALGVAVVALVIWRVRKA